MKIKVYQLNLLPVYKMCFNWGKVTTLPWLVLITVGFNLSCSKIIITFNLMCTVEIT